ncbi:DNA-binding response regulator [Mycetocola manganoxydans]|uniref:DNA-binding response regulator n=1 Tax=Mycetocola manganoxydans TaxID=699879 RepID=A0A3L6ZLH8_9MICO|nr:response regulator transcription factor [Mycetocola manganoxydans]RLP68683.1 DNA-binding response regulator [Mycetocola manganoxydans]GHD45359.1 DNA-binding response regulator [Mycetocola manganoxydans]
MTIRVMIVDDQDLLRMGLAMVLAGESDMEVVGEAADGATAIERAGALLPDVILMDVRMPSIDGIEATRRIIADRPDAKVIILTTFDLDEYAFGGLNAGASGFLLKDAPPAELLSAVRAVATGEASVSPRITRRMLDLFGGKLPVAGTTAGPGRLAVLTEREREVLEAIGKGLSNPEIARALFLSESTVKTHVGRILQKLELRDRVQAVILAHQEGLA